MKFIPWKVNDFYTYKVLICEELNGSDTTGCHLFLVLSLYYLGTYVTVQTAQDTKSLLLRMRRPHAKCSASALSYYEHNFHACACILHLPGRLPISHWVICGLSSGRQANKWERTLLNWLMRPQMVLYRCLEPLSLGLYWLIQTQWILSSCSAILLIWPA